MSKLTNDLIKIGAVAGVGWFLYKQVKKEFQPAADPYLVSETSAAQSLTQLRTLPNGRQLESPYVYTAPSPYTQEPIVIIQKETQFGDPSRSGLAATSLSEAEYAALDPNDKRALEKGQFTVTDQGMLITGTNRLISLLPGSLIQLGSDLGSRLKDLTSTSSYWSNLFGPASLALNLAEKYLKPSVPISPEIKSVEMPVTELRTEAPRIQQAAETVATKTLISSGAAPDPRFAGTQESLKYARGF